MGSYGNAANTVVFPLTVVALAIAVMVGDGCCAFVSMALGQEEPAQAKRCVGNAVVLTVDLRGAIGFSSCGVLLYYAIANASAWTQDRTHRLYPRWLQALGLAGCLALAAAVPWQSLTAGAAVLVVGLTGRALLRR